MSNTKVTNMADVKGDSRLWSAEQMLEDLLADIRAGKLKPEHMIVLAWEKTPEGRLRKSSWCQNFTTAEYCAFLASAAHDSLHDWKDGR